MSHHNRKIAVIGLGYVGLPVAIAFGKISETIGFDIDRARIEELKSGEDRTGEVSSKDIKTSNVLFTNSIDDLKKANFYIIAVPTPINSAYQPDLTAMLNATETVGGVLKSGDIVVYESTVYPGATEEDCVPVLERISNLKCGKDFKVGYSPERINPGDKKYIFTNILKIVSGQDEETTNIIASIYESAVTAGVFKATSIKVAEAAKVIENTQRDLNIALMNELALICDRLNICTNDVLEAAGTKWNFLKFKPGLVGGHCIGVDPYYLTHKAETLGYIPQVILAGRRINNSMGKFIASKTIKEMIRSGCNICDSTVTVLGITFKEDCSDCRNSKIIDIINELKEFNIKVQVHDPLADRIETEHKYGISIQPLDSLQPANAIIVAVAHKQYRELKMHQLVPLLKTPAVLIDVKGIYNPKEIIDQNLCYWCL